MSSDMSSRELGEPTDGFGCLILIVIAVVIGLTVKSCFAGEPVSRDYQCTKCSKPSI